MRCRFFIIAVLSFSFLKTGSAQTGSVSEQKPPDIQKEKFQTFLDSLKRADATDIATVNEIRKYLAAQIDIGQSKDKLFETYYKIPWDSLSAFACLDLFGKNKLTAKCGLTSYLLSKLYAYAGYKSYIYDCGYTLHGKDSATVINHEGRVVPLSHEFNLVELNGILQVQDAFMDMTIVNPDNSPKDFFELLNEIKKQDFSRVKIMQDTALSEFWTDSITASMRAEMLALPAYQTYAAHVDTIDNRLRVMLKRDFGFLSEGMIRDMRLVFAADKLEENFLSIYLKPLYLKDGITGAPADALFQKIKSITGIDSQD